MSSIGLDPVETANFADQVARSPLDSPANSWFTKQTILSPFAGVATGVERVGFGLEELGGAIARPFAQQIDDQFGTSSADWIDQQQKRARAAIVSQYVDPETYGKAGEILGGTTQFIAEAMTGEKYIRGGGAAITTGIPEGLVSYQKHIAEGVDPLTATMLATLEGGAAAGLSVLPLSGKSAADAALRQAVVLPFANAWQRGVTHEILDNAGYHDMAAQYKMFDTQAILTDAALAALFGGGMHALHGAPPPAAERVPVLTDAVLTSAVAQHIENTAPGIPADNYTRTAHNDAVNSSIDALLNGRPVDPSGVIDPERANFVPDPHADNFAKAVQEVAAEEVGPLPADGEPPTLSDAVTPAAPHPESEIVSPIDRSATPEEKVNQMVALSNENAPAVDSFLAGVDRDFGTESKSNFKDPENILSKSQRPSILAQKPWFGVEHIRDAFRFKTVLSDLSSLPEILTRAREQGWQMVKADTAKVLAPKEWGFRIAAFDMRMPNGQIVEYYMPVREMEAAKDAGHLIFEKWRNRDPATLSEAEGLEMQADIKKSQALYGGAWDAYLKRTGQDESAVRAALAKSEAAASGANANDSNISSIENLRPEVQLPAASREAIQPESSTYALPSSATPAVGVMGLSDESLTKGSVAENLPSVEPIVPAAKGAPTEVKIGDKYVPATWAVVDSSEIKATMGGAENQARDRNRAASAVQIAEIANKLDFKLLGESPVMDFGAPTLANDGRIVGGNGRVEAIKQAYELGHGQEAYADKLKADAARYGLDPADFAGVKEPVLVRILEKGVDVRQAALASNEGGAMRMSALEQAKVDAERLPDTRFMASNEAGSMNLTANKEIIGEWLNQYPAGQRAALMDADGRLSAEGVTRLRNAMLAKAYGESPTLTRLVEDADPDIKNIGNALVRAAPHVASGRAGMEAGALHPADLGPDLVQAVEAFAKAKAEGRSVVEVAGQGDLVGELSPEAKKLLLYMNKYSRSPRALSDVLTGYYEKLRAAGNPGQGDVFGAAAPTKGAILDEAIASKEKATALEKDVQQSLLEQPGMQIPGENGELTTASDAIAAADKAIKDAEKAPDMLDAAINCDRKAA